MPKTINVNKMMSNSNKKSLTKAKEAPFKVACKDYRTFHIVLQVIDNKRFISDIYRLRRKWKNYKNVWRFPISVNTSDDANRTKENKVSTDIISVDVQKLIFKYKLEPYFSTVIEQAVIWGSIGIFDSVSCYPIYTERHETAIVIHPDTTEKELIKVFKEVKSNHSRILDEFKVITKGDMKQVDWVPKKIFQSPIPKFRKIKDTYPNIERDRKWYWMYQKGMSYGEIFNLVTSGPNRIAIDSRDTVIKAVKKYQQFLSSV